ncbi:hypothetical protein E2C01_079307 [Portunus trituberculatus]|uniref:Uncharacterized protein n=1 Tax=Portunus trituberculatus TaxID=210409 RepID=A0A5B7ISE2_PORTR|nr:hypothetical protein [Portunus trituberculatus]
MIKKNTLLLSLLFYLLFSMVRSKRKVCLEPGAWNKVIWSPALQNHKHSGPDVDIEPRWITAG